MSTTNPTVSAWIFLVEDEPKGTSYKTAGSCYQSLIENGVYNYTDYVSICWVNTVSTANGSSIQLQQHTHPDGSSNQQYMEWLIADAKKVNPDVKVLVMLGYGSTEISQVFSGDESGWSAQAATYAQNIVSYLKEYGLDGLDVDWEPNLSVDTTPKQFKLAFTAIGEAFAAQSPPLTLAIGPSTAENMDAATANKYFTWVAPQFYCGVPKSEFTDAGIDSSILGYGAKFETDSGVPYQSAEQAYQAYKDGHFSSIIQWRLNSGDYQYEQAQQMILYQLVKGVPGQNFDDGPIVAAAGDPTIQSVTVRSGEVVDAIQVTNGSTVCGNAVTYPLLQHGGDGGHGQTFTVQAGDAIVKVSGYTGSWFGHRCVVQIAFETKNGQTFGPYGTMTHVEAKEPFIFTAPSGQTVLAFSGETLPVTLAGGQATEIIGALAARCG